MRTTPQVVVGRSILHLKPIVHGLFAIRCALTHAHFQLGALVACNRGEAMQMLKAYPVLSVRVAKPFHIGVPPRAEKSGRAVLPLHKDSPRSIIPELIAEIAPHLKTLGMGLPAWVDRVHP